ncbi:TPA: hypothetical protein RHJ96_002960, partial [Enterococcus faecalis]|nr:hypothetical protein [Enterococcus faecalis]
MDYVILIGSIIAAIGLILLMMTTRFVWGWNWGYPYRTTNKPLAIIGWLLIIIGVVIV